MREPRLAAIVCTHDRPHDLERCLAAFAELREEIELVVVDSASAVPVKPVVDRFAERIPGLRCVRVDRPGLSVARNAGIAHTRAPFIAFVDDDAAPEPGWAQALLAGFGDSSVGCVGGRCDPDFEITRPRWLSDRLLQMAGITRFGAVAREPRSRAEWPFGANIAFRRAAVAQSGDFDPALGRHGTSLLSGEESDLIARLQARGWRVWLEPAAAVRHTVHAERCTSRYYWRRLWWAGVSRAGDPRAGWRLLAATPVRAALFAVTGDRLYLYRLAETAGYFIAVARRRRSRPVGVT